MLSMVSLWLEPAQSFAGSCAGSPNLTNTNTVREHLLDALRCLFARRELLFVCSALRGGAGALLQGGSHSTGVGGKIAHSLGAQRCFANYVEIRWAHTPSHYKKL